MHRLSFAPQSLVILARVMLLPCLAVFAAAIVVFDGSTGLCMGLSFAALVLVLQALPYRRNGDLIGLLVLGVTLLEWLHAGNVGAMDEDRWQACVAVLGGAFVLLRVQHLRSLARQDPYVPLRQLERRGALMARTVARRSSR